ncbi:MAG: dTDP-4-dehydrorhamnose reductase [Rhodospirillaceae bacterium]|nr:dTDP-4-dehydrorhamnose reductase [Rhodospirillaceae bacterium]
MSVDLLLTGANGQLGWEVARRAASAGLSVAALAHADLDVAEGAKVRETVATHTPKVIVNAAAYTAVDKAESARDQAFAVNRDGPTHLAESCAATGAALIHVSTDYVFDGTKLGAYLETDPVGPLGAYGASKLAGEEEVRARTPRHVILRTAWVYGAHGGNFVKTMLRLARERPELRVVDDQRGCPTAAGDLAEAVLAIASRIARGAVPADGFGTFHCVGAGEVSWCGFAREIMAQTGSRLGKTPPPVTAITTADYPTPARRPANSVLDCSKLQRVYGLSLRPWQAALAEVLDGLL